MTCCPMCRSVSITGERDLLRCWTTFICHRCGQEWQIRDDVMYRLGRLPLLDQNVTTWAYGRER